MPSSNSVLPLFAVSLLLIGGCASSHVILDSSEGPLANENLHSVLWVQTSVEYEALTQQVYQMATYRIDDALADTAWTASIEQMERGSYGTLPPAIVLDIDETVLDNSAYQARLIRSNSEYQTSTWQNWVREEVATAIPGALDFILEAESRGIAIIYLSNRRAETESSTRANLTALGFPVSENYDAIISRGEQADWDTGDKRTRREAVADRFRIIMLIGDNLGDFMPDAEQSIEERRAMVQPYDAFWGRRWFMLPNPQYGSWESALFDHDFSLDREERLRIKQDRLDTAN